MHLTVYSKTNDPRLYTWLIFYYIRAISQVLHIPLKDSSRDFTDRHATEVVSRETLLIFI